MAAMTKYVNVRTRIAVRNTNPPICGSYTGVMTTGDILKCLCKRAKVEEVLPDGKTVLLNMSNYYTDNGAGLDARVHHPIVKKAVEDAPRFRVPVPQEQAQVVETKTQNAVEEAVKADESVTVNEEPVAEPIKEEFVEQLVTHPVMTMDETVTEFVTEVANVEVVDEEPQEEAEEVIDNASEEELVKEDGEETTTDEVESTEEPKRTNPNHSNNKKKKKH